MKKFGQLGKNLSKEEQKRILGGVVDPGGKCSEKKCGGGDHLTWSLACTSDSLGCACSRTDYSWSNC